MQVTIEIPDRIAEQMQQQWHNLPQKLLENLSVEAYNAGILSRKQIQQLLTLPSLYEVDGFLKQSGAFLPYSEADFDQDLATMQKLRDMSTINLAVGWVEALRNPTPISLSPPNAHHRHPHLRQPQRQHHRRL